MCRIVHQRIFALGSSLMGFLERTHVQKRHCAYDTRGCTPEHYLARWSCRNITLTFVTPIDVVLCIALIGKYMDT